MSSRGRRPRHETYASKRECLALVRTCATGAESQIAPTGRRRIGADPPKHGTHAHLRHLYTGVDQCGPGSAPHFLHMRSASPSLHDRGSRVLVIVWLE